MLCGDVFDEPGPEMKIKRIVVVNRNDYLCESMFRISCGLLEAGSTQVKPTSPKESLIWKGEVEDSQGD